MPESPPPERRSASGSAVQTFRRHGRVNGIRSTSLQSESCRQAIVSACSEGRADGDAHVSEQNHPPLPPRQISLPRFLNRGCHRRHFSSHPSRSSVKVVCVFVFHLGLESNGRNSCSPIAAQIPHLFSTCSVWIEGPPLPTGSPRSERTIGKLPLPTESDIRSPPGSPRGKPRLSG